MNATNCQRERFRIAYLQTKELGITKEAFAEGLGLSVSAVMQKVAAEDLPSHSHSSLEQAEKAEAFVAMIATELGKEIPKIEGAALVVPPARPAAATTTGATATATATATEPATARTRTRTANNTSSKPVKVKYLEANDVMGKYRYVTPAAEAVGQFDHANTLEEIVEKVKIDYAPRIVLEEIGDDE